MNASVDGLIRQRTGNKSGDDLELARKIATENPGFTATQIGWAGGGASVGFYVDDKGFCQPAELFAAFLQVFNIKRRVSERAFESEALADHPRAVFRYGHAVRNPYEFGGQGIYPLDYKQPMANAAYQPVSSCATPPPVSVPRPAAMPGELLALIGGD